MRKIYMFVDENGNVPVQEFMKTLEEKERKKLEYGLNCLATQPNYLTPPNVKHFSIERYNMLYEYRARIRRLIRVIFTVLDDGDILLLCPFIKRHDRNTMQALNQSLLQLSDTTQDRMREYVTKVS